MPVDSVQASLIWHCGNACSAKQKCLDLGTTCGHLVDVGEQRAHRVLVLYVQRHEVQQPEIVHDLRGAKHVSSTRMSKSHLSRRHAALQSSLRHVLLQMSCCMDSRHDIQEGPHLAERCSQAAEAGWECCPTRASIFSHDLCQLAEVLCLCCNDAQNLKICSAALCCSRGVGRGSAVAGPKQHRWQSTAGSHLRVEIQAEGWPPVGRDQVHLHA